jgi:hypothetical protein
MDVWLQKGGRRQERVSPISACSQSPFPAMVIAGLPVISDPITEGRGSPRTSSLSRVADRLADSLTILKRRVCNGGLPAAAFKQQLTYTPLRLKSIEKETNHHGQNAGSGFR